MQHTESKKFNKVTMLVTLIKKYVSYRIQDADNVILIDMIIDSHIKNSRVLNTNKDTET